jgi:hypothetical protein
MRYYILLLFLVCLRVPLRADIYFPDTKPDTTTESTYSEKKVKGKEIYSVNVFPKQLYYAFISPGDITVVNCPYKIKEIVVGGQNLVKPEYKKNGSFFTLKPPAYKVGASTTLQVVCEKGFTALLTVKIAKKMDANKVIYLLDGKDSTNTNYSREHFEEMQHQYKEKLEKRSFVMKQLFFDETQKLSVEKTIRIKDSKLILKNIVFSGNKYFYNLEFVGDDNLALKKEDVFLYITNYNNFVLSEQKKDKLLQYPDSILLYSSVQGRQFATITFEILAQDRTKTFYSELHISKMIIFDNKINLSLLEINNFDLFDAKVN